MSARLTRIFETDPTAAPVDPDLRAFVALAVKVTARPQEVTPEDVRAAYSAALSPRHAMLERQAAALGGLDASIILNPPSARVR